MRGRARRSGAPPHPLFLLNAEPPSPQGRGRPNNPRYFTSPLARAWSFAITAQSCSASPWATAPTSRSRQTLPLGRGTPTASPPVTLDDRRLERLRPKLGHPQLDLAGLGLQLALVVTGPWIATGLAALVTLRIAQPIRLSIQQGVQCLLHAAANHAVEVALDPLIVNRDDIAQSDSVYPRSWRLPSADLVAFSHLQFSQIRGPPALPNCAKHSLRHLRCRFAELRWSIHTTVCRCN